MDRYEFTVIPAPSRLRRLAGARAEESYAMALGEILSEMGSAGWDFAGAERLPCRIGRWPFGGRRRERHVLVFRRNKVARAEMMDAPFEDALVCQSLSSVRPRRVPTGDAGPRAMRTVRPTLDPLTP